ncbi:hypothetical protein SAMN05216267_100396 [Actinacidiphila rubida]|uniref:Uncharacterized protein n=1 Tax=Actinacidiphila rubida TaxID=310780 RepID=A0A1H8F2D9_9ACTN|nr:hypothetical protein SAMN05216267_100396 [Actinacidiphila rubida]
MFDESFVRAARIQEYSARERLDGAARAVRVRHGLPRILARQAVALALLLVLAFGFAIYMGVRHPYHADTAGPTPTLQVSVIPLVPSGTVPAVAAADPFAGSPADRYRVGEAGINFDAAERVGDFAESEVMQAYATIKDYISESALDPKAVTGGDVGAVRNLLDPGQLDQFEASVTRPTSDGSHEATGWLVRFDPAEHLRLVGGGNGVRVDGGLKSIGTSGSALVITADHTFVYALRGPGTTDTPISLFTVRRHLQFRFSHLDLEQRHIQVVDAEVAAGPLSCGSAAGYFRPILAGGRATGTVTGVNPYEQDGPVGPDCAPLGSKDGPAPWPSVAAGPSAGASTAPGTAGTSTAPGTAGTGRPSAGTSTAPGTGAPAGTGATATPTPGRAQATGLTPPQQRAPASHPAL